jgi:hypothetical protein
MKTVSCSATPSVLNEWFAAFGLGDSEKTNNDDNDDENRTVDVSDDTVYYQHSEMPGDGSLRHSNSSAVSVACDPNKCRMLYGICCDCCKCLNHCKCGDLKQLPPTCDTPDCSDRVCPQCMRCHHHCLCRCSTVRAEHDGYYLASAKESPKSVMQTQRAVGTSCVAPPLFTEEVTSQSSVWENCYDPYVHGDDDTDEEMTIYQHSEEDDWMGNNTRIVTSDGTVATMATAKTDATLRRSKTNFEVVYDQNYTNPSKATSSYALPTYSQKQQQPNQKKTTRSSWNFHSRPKGVAAMGEF